MQDHQLLTLHWRSFSEWGRERPSTCLLYKGCQYIRICLCRTIVSILQLTVGYLNATTNRKTWNAEPEIGIKGSSLTRHHLRVDGYGSGFCPPLGSELAFRMGQELTWPVFTIRTRTAGVLPEPVAHTRYPQCSTTQQTLIPVTLTTPAERSWTNTVKGSSWNWNASWPEVSGYWRRIYQLMAIYTY